MSHKSTYKCIMSNLDVLKRVLNSKGIEYRENYRVKLYGSQGEKAAVGFKLPGWRFECAVTEKGEIKYDHYGSERNSFEKLGDLCQSYNKEVIMMEAWGLANNVWETNLDKGAIKLTLEF